MLFSFPFFQQNAFFRASYSIFVIYPIQRANSKVFQDRSISYTENNSFKMKGIASASVACSGTLGRGVDNTPCLSSTMCKVVIKILSKGPSD